jgi:hypothetical protein
MRKHMHVHAMKRELSRVHDARPFRIALMFGFKLSSTCAKLTQGMQGREFQLSSASTAQLQARALCLDMIRLEHDQPHVANAGLHLHVALRACRASNPHAITHDSW